MSKFLSIIVPHYNEEEKVVKPLLDSIAVQANFDLNEVEVIIVDDGDDAYDLSGLVKNYDYTIKYIKNIKMGVSAARNRGLDEAEGDYVMWCDCDDKFYHCLALWLIKTETKTPMVVGTQQVIGYDALVSVFLEEGRHPETKETLFIQRQDGFQFVHGKVFNKKFILDNGIRFFDDCTIHEDHVLFAQVNSCTQNIKFCPSPFYLWTWNDNSVCRRDKDYLLKTYVDLMKSTDRLIDWYKGKSKWDNAKQTVCQIVIDAYYSFNCKRWKKVTSEEYRQLSEKRFSELFHKYKDLWETSDENLKMQISNGVRQRCIQDMEGLNEFETETLNDFLKRIEAIN